jgi:hypothetical protein
LFCGSGKFPIKSIAFSLVDSTATSTDTAVQSVFLFVSLQASATMAAAQQQLSTADSYAITKRNKVKRLPARGQYDKDSVYRVLDEGYICHVGFEVDGQPFVIPTGYGREGDVLYLHGSSASRYGVPHTQRAR